MIQDVTYNSLLRERRKELHRAVGYAIEELYPDRLVDHYSRYPEAIAESERMLDLARAAGDRRSEGEALLDLAFSYWYTSPWEHIPQTPRFAEEALAVAREIGDQHMLAKSLSHLGLIDQVHGNLAEGDRKYEESLRIGELGGFTDVISQDLWSLGSHANWRGARPSQTSARL